eukprot:759513-Hanusia_phi.AAC.9
MRSRTKITCQTSSSLKASALRKPSFDPPPCTTHRARETLSRTSSLTSTLGCSARISQPRDQQLRKEEEEEKRRRRRRRGGGEEEEEEEEEETRGEGGDKRRRRRKEEEGGRGGGGGGGGGAPE